MMRRVTILVLALVCAMALLPGGAEARPKGLGGLFGIITNPIGSILGAAHRAGRRAIPHRRSSASRHRGKSAPAAAAATAAGAAVAVSTSAAAAPSDSGTPADSTTASVVPDSVLPQPKPGDGGATAAKPARVSVTEPDAVPMPVPAPGPSAQPDKPKPAATPARRLGLVGPAAWPSAFEDVIGYALWPSDYAGRLRVHGVGDVLATAFTPPGVLLAEAREKTESHKPQRTGRRASVCDRAGVASAEDWPTHEIAQSLHLDDSQRTALDEFKAAIADGVTAVQRSCRDATAPVDRLRAMEAMLWAVHDAAQAVRAPLAKFYDSLTEQQQKQFAAPRDDDSKRSGRSDLVRICASPHELPKKNVEQSLHTTKPQRASLDALQKKSFEMGQFLMASCLRPIAATPPERLDAAADRLTAVIFAASSLNIALNDFTGRLDGDQKTRLETLAR